MKRVCVGCGRITERTRCSRCQSAQTADGSPRKPKVWRPERGTAAWRRMRDTVWARDCGVCQRCGREIAEGQRWDLGHRVAFAAGGTFTADNLQVEHVRCNRGAREQ